MDPTALGMRTDLIPEIGIEPDIDADVSVEDSIIEFQNSEKTVYNVFVTYVGDSNDKVTILKVPDEVSTSVETRAIVLLTHATYPIGTEKVVRQLDFINYGKGACTIVSMKNCTAAEKKWVSSLLPESESGCILC